jgi:hypothetical protein
VLGCWLIRLLIITVPIAMMCACLQTNSQLTHIAHMKMIYVAGMKKKWHGSDRMVHIPTLPVRTTHTKMQQVSSLPSHRLYTLVSTNWQLLWSWWNIITLHFHLWLSFILQCLPTVTDVCIFKILDLAKYWDDWDTLAVCRCLFVRQCVSCKYGVRCYTGESSISPPTLLPQWQ